MKPQKLAFAKRALILFLVLFALFFIDQLTKLLAQAFLDGKNIVLIPNGWLWLAYSLNDAVAFNMGSGNKAFMTAVIVLTPVLAAAFVALALTVFRKNSPAQVALFVISAGALGNFADRLLVFENGVPVVRDFIGLKFFNICNFADFCITLGAAALVIILLFIGPQAAFPLKAKWREQAKREEENGHGKA